MAYQASGPCILFDACCLCWGLNVSINADQECVSFCSQLECAEHVKLEQNSIEETDCITNHVLDAEQ